MKAIELEGVESKQNNDDIDMARLGKSPVLKVWRPTCLPQTTLCIHLLTKDNSEILASCPSWVSVVR